MSALHLQTKYLFYLLTSTKEDNNDEEQLPGKEEPYNLKLMEQNH